MIASGLFHRNSLAAVLHLEMLVGAREEQGALYFVTVTCLQDNMDGIFCPEEDEPGKHSGKKRSGSLVTAMTKKLQGLSLLKGDLAFFICGKEELAILDQKRRELAR